MVGVEVLGSMIAGRSLRPAPVTGDTFRRSTVCASSPATTIGLGGAVSERASTAIWFVQSLAGRQRGVSTGRGSGSNVVSHRSGPGISQSPTAPPWLVFGQPSRLYQATVPSCGESTTARSRAVATALGMNQGEARAAVRTAGAIEVAVGLAVVVRARGRWPFVLTAVGMPVLTAAARHTDLVVCSAGLSIRCR